jgi:hypothetical protein
MDDLQNAKTLDETPVPPWYPSRKLRGRLLRGAWATMGAGALSLAGALADPDLDLFPGFSVADALGWAGLVPLLFVLHAYRGLAEETQSHGLARSSLCLFGTIALSYIFGLATLNGLPVGWQIGAWLVIGFGLLFLVMAPFVSAEGELTTSASAEMKTTEPAKPAPVTETKDGTASKASRVGILGGLGVALVVLLKVFAKGLFVKMLIIGRVFRKLNLEEIEGLAGGALLILGAIFFVWFAVAKIRLRAKLGGIAAVVGWLEILLLVLAATLLVWLVAATVAAANQAGFNEKDLEALFHHRSRELLPLEVVGIVVWTALTMFLFLSVRSRVDLEQEWNADLTGRPVGST